MFKLFLRQMVLPILNYDVQDRLHWHDSKGHERPSQSGSPFLAACESDPGKEQRHKGNFSEEKV